MKIKSETKLIVIIIFLLAAVLFTSYNWYVTAESEETHCRLYNVAVDYNNAVVDAYNTGQTYENTIEKLEYLDWCMAKSREEDGVDAGAWSPSINT